MRVKTLPDMAPPLADCTQHTLNYQDGTRRVVYCTEVEVPFPDGQLIVSRTDLAGVITHANNAFVLMSGYELDELIGAPHHILRHPDMPAVAFADLWETVNRGEKWSGYVKNLRADGGFYWVFATVIPNVRNGHLTGFTSVRRKPSRRAVKHCSAAYAALLV